MEEKNKQTNEKIEEVKVENDAQAIKNEEIKKKEKIVEKTKKITRKIAFAILMILLVFYVTDLIRIKLNMPVIFSMWGRQYEVEYEETEMQIVTSLEDKITENTAWCGTFNLIWNDLKKDLAKQDIVFQEQTEKVINLNRGTFSTKDLSEDSYYKVYGKPTPKLKEQIEKAIRIKFNEKSDILDDFDFEGAGENDYFLYAMLKKDFKFENVFTELENGKFGNYENVQYFGINEQTEEVVRNQVKVLYYESKDNFAIKLTTKENDEIILLKGIKKDNFLEIYKEITEQSEKYEGNKNFTEMDKLKIPNISFKLKEEIKEVENKPFRFSDGREYVIQKALQTIQFDLDKEGGKIKSEAGMMLKESAIIKDEIENREFYIDDTFTIFLQEEGKELPYFAAQISNIGNVQENIK